MKTTIYKSNSRGNFDYGWLKTYHTFSFASYYDPQRIHFGMLRVFNDDFIQSGKGFDTHFHDNMEIITIPFSGALEHKDSNGNTEIIRNGDVQVMSAGSGIYHSEYSKSDSEFANIFQIWIFPDKKDVSPRYDQYNFDKSLWAEKFYTLVKPEGNQGLWINQRAYISRGYFSENTKSEYQIQHSGNGVYVFVANGKIKIGDEVLHSRDSIGISEVPEITFEMLENSDLIIIDVPMN